jgi:CBS domain-containing protein
LLGGASRLGPAACASRFDQAGAIVCRAMGDGLRVERATAVLARSLEEIFCEAVAAAMVELGPSPCAFVILGLGSIGRGEAMLAPDQDTAILYADDGESDQVGDYFRRLGQAVTARVAESGIPACDAGNSAANPSWCLSESGWRQRFSGWINDSLPDDLLQVNIFFDLRTLVGDEELTERLRHHIFSEVTARPIFLYYLAESTINFRLPADPLGRLRAEGPDGNVLNLKKVMLHFVSFVRIYALRHGLEETNTVARLETLAAGNLLPRDLAEETLATWRYLLERRFQAQMTAAAGGFSDHNLLFLDQLGHWEQTLVKMAAGHIANLQRRLSKDFTRAA